jgi:hypothetical protein
MAWNAHLRHPLTLSNGATLRTLADARDFVLSLPPREQARPHWQSLTGLLLSAANSANPTLIALVTDRVRDALSIHGAVHLVDEEKKPAAKSVRRDLKRKGASGKRIGGKQVQ